MRRFSARVTTPDRRNARTLYVPSAFVKPTPANTGPRVARTVDVRTAITGFNTASVVESALPEDQGVVRLSGLNFTVAGGLQFLGTNGGPNLHTKYILRDCEFPGGVSFDGGFRGVVDIDYCKSTYIGINSPSGKIGHSIWNQTGNLDAQGRTAGIPSFMTRYDSSTVLSTTNTPTPWAVTDSIYLCGYPNLAIDATDPHYEAVHIRGGDGITFDNCVLDCGYRYKADGVTINPDVTAVFSCEGGNGGYGLIAIRNSYVYGSNQFEIMLNIDWVPNFIFADNRIGHIKNPGDTTREGLNRAAPGINFNSIGSGPAVGATFARNVWDVDGTPVAPGFLGRPAADGGNTTQVWY